MNQSRSRTKSKKQSAAQKQSAVQVQVQVIPPELRKEEIETPQDISHHKGDYQQIGLGCYRRNPTSRD
jgi:hypothetical protein